jgi:hypothetical protein
MLMSQAQNTFEWALALFGGGIGLRVGFLAIRSHIRTLRSHTWPAIPGIVQRGETLRPGSGGYIRSGSVQSRFGYAYTVDTRSHFGFFVVLAEDMLSADQLQKRLDGCSVTVRYDPQNPEISVLEDKKVAGCGVIQDPLWVNST